MPKVSVIMPAYNAAAYLEESVQSLINQSFQDWELLLVDDCSKDETPNIAKRLTKKDSRIQFIQKEKNSGSADTRNQGIHLAKGEYIAFLDADDLWETGFLNTMIPFMEKKHSPFSFASYRIIDEDGFEFCEPFIVDNNTFNYRNLLHYNRVGLLTAIYHVPTVGKVFFDPSLKSLRDDYALWLDILRDGKIAYANSEILARYRVRRGAATSNKKKVMIAHFRMLRNREKLNYFYALSLTLIHGFMGIRKYRIKA